MAQISEVTAREILDSRGIPTIEVLVRLNDGSHGSAAVPSGASTGAHEALELRDQDPSRYLGKGVLNAVHNVNSLIAPQIIGMEITDQSIIDEKMLMVDGTSNKSELGANSILGVSLATAHARANSLKVPLYATLASDEAITLPTPMMNVLNGGKHAMNSTDFQEFMIIPVEFEKFSEALRCGAEIYQALKGLLSRLGMSTNVGDEGGVAPSLASNSEPLDLLIEAISDAGYKPGKDVFLALDVAATELFQNDHYFLEREGERMTSDALIDRYEQLVSSYPILSIEDGVAEDDWNGWATMTERLGGKIQIVGDDRLTTNPKRIEHGISLKAANSVLVKLNQIGSLTETISGIKIAKKAGWTTVISHRSGETEDTTIADLAVGTGSGQIKTGAPARSERVAKYKRLLQIEQELGSASSYAGKDPFVRYSNNKQ